MEEPHDPPWAELGKAAWVLEVEKGGVKIEEVVLKKAVSVVGREGDVVLAHESVSRRHAVVAVRGDEGVWIKDLGSVYGTTVDGIKVSDWTKMEGPVRFGFSTRSLRARRQDSASKKKATDGGRAARAAEIAELTRAMVQDAPTWTAPLPEEEDEAKASSSEDEGPQPAEEEEEEEEAAGSSSRGEEEDKEEQARRLGIPASHEAVFGGGNTPAGKSVTVIEADEAGNRVVIGTSNGVLRLHDFGGMDRRLKPFREVDADEGAHAVVALSFSPTGDRFLSCVAGPQPRIFDRDGKPLLRFNRGDPYVRDPTKTTGHTTTVTGGAWQPHQKFRTATCSVDGSVRLWDLCGKTGLRDWLFSESVIRVRDGASRKVAATAMSFSHDGGSVCCAAADGSIQYWRIRGRAHAYLKPDACQRRAHRPAGDASGCVVSCVVFSPDDSKIASRADDGRVKVWDLRALSRGALFDAPIAAHRAQPTANLAFSPDGRYLVAPTDAHALECFDIGSLGLGETRPVLGLSLGGHDGAVDRPRAGGGAGAAFEKKQQREKNPGASRVLWHPRLNQVLAGDTLGAARLLYDPELSAAGKGALRVVDRDFAKRKRGLDYAHNANLHNTALELGERKSEAKLARSARSTGYAKMRTDPKLSKMPAPPLEQGQQGRNTGAKSTFSQFWLDRNLPDNIRNQDPRDALLKYADEPAIFRTDATFYRDAQGKPVLGDQTLEQAEASFLDQQLDILKGRHRSSAAAAGGGSSHHSTSSNNHHQHQKKDGGSTTR